MSAAMIHDLFRPEGLKDFPGPFARRARQTAEELRASWEAICRDAAMNRRLEELHATRDDYEALLSGHLRLLKDYLTLATLHQQVLDSDPTWREELSRAVDELQRLHDELFPRWQTQDDLYRILIERFTPSVERQKELAVKYPPPQSWYDETDDPFSAV